MLNQKKEFVVIGLGRFGSSLCMELTDIGIEVVAIDKDPEKVGEFSSIVSHAVELDAVDEEGLNSVGIRNFDCVVVSIGEDIQASILITLILKEMGIKQVWVKARNHYHQKVLEKIGADRIIHPERDMARRIAHHIGNDKVTDYIEISKSYSIVEIMASDKLAGKTLGELDAFDKYHCKIVAIKKNEDDVSVMPSLNTRIDLNDILVTIGKNKNLDKFEEERV
ncbi:TrkA family potassium uptake protein [Aquibacillus koreensis]|uniref:TrkA family potassium uptake protein n=1 Tax=Aquibacillus koreensis TaxID=279446 RepID=A0A9X3WQ19_9BACI|nr:TrkA family potassium uptake protein [Aquibacillus koreensis]MCT2535268.1 TrkA family potassium uptake protein [Aquibacillus koreensis]MDC3422773.1 TrkA family potassium uptake protein [Aquibacillus koreensis]